MLEGVIVNIVLNRNNKTSEVGMDNLIGLIKENILKAFSLSEDSFIHIPCNSYFQELRKLDFKTLPNTVVTITKNYNNTLVTGNHSDRFYSLELSERNSSKHVVNVQIDIESGIEFLTFTVGDTSLTKAVVDTLIASYYQFDNQLALGK